MSSERFVIPSGYTKIGEHAFSWCSTLKNNIIPKNLKESFCRLSLPLICKINKT